MNKEKLSALVWSAAEVLCEAAALWIMGYGAMRLIGVLVIWLGLG